MVKSTQDARLMDNNVKDTEEEETDEFLLDVVCFTCPYLDQCGQGQEYNSITCIWMRDWLSASIQRWQEEYEYVEEGKEEK